MGKPRESVESMAEVIMRLLAVRESGGVIALNMGGLIAAVMFERGMFKHGISDYPEALKASLKEHFDCENSNGSLSVPLTLLRHEG